MRRCNLAELASLLCVDLDTRGDIEAVVDNNIEAFGDLDIEALVGFDLEELVELCQDSISQMRLRQ